MSVQELVFVKAMSLIGTLESREGELLKLFCRSAWQSLMGRLREDVSVESCQDVLVDAAGLYALAALRDADGGPRRFSTGELTVERDGMSAATLRAQADTLVKPLVRDEFLFVGV